MQMRQGKASPGANSEEPRQCIPNPSAARGDFCANGVRNRTADL